WSAAADSVVGRWGHLLVRFQQRLGAHRNSVAGWRVRRPMPGRAKRLPHHTHFAARYAYCNSFRTPNCRQEYSCTYGYTYLARVSDSHYTNTRVSL
ncbi:MAG: hypothetical protein K8J31_09170, partial [Anaerolineae bacterium]|nr:hypothetical protein [Anaerolineae bacterium]